MANLVFNKLANEFFLFIIFLLISNKFCTFGYLEPFSTLQQLAKCISIKGDLEYELITGVE